jgi:outer membrane protein
VALKSFIIALCLGLLANPLIAAESNDQNRGELRDRVEPKGWLYGFGLGINGEIYKGYDRRVIPLPLIGYRGDKLLVLGPFANY